LAFRSFYHFFVRDKKELLRDHEKLNILFFIHDRYEFNLERDSLCLSQAYSIHAVDAIGS